MLSLASPNYLEEGDPKSEKILCTMGRYFKRDVKGEEKKHFLIFEESFCVPSSFFSPANALANYLEEGDLKLMHTLHNQLIRLKKRYF